MQLGIDFGTTRTVIAFADRGNYPVVTFLDNDSDFFDYYPSIAAIREDGELVFGFDALDVEGEGGPVLRSFKRMLADPNVTGQSKVCFGGKEFALADFLTRFLESLNHRLATNSSIAEQYASEVGSHQVSLGVPAHANSAQRFLTLSCFKAAGFEVKAMLNEPSAAGFEYTFRKPNTVNSKRTKVLIYDLGGGTFDASLVSVNGHDHRVLESVGINDLGGDDFDQVLIDYALETCQKTAADLSPSDMYDLVFDARVCKEGLVAQNHKMYLCVGDDDVILDIAEYYRRVMPLVERTLSAITERLQTTDFVEDLGTDGNIAAVYLVGGAASLPLIIRVIKQRFAKMLHRIYRAPYATAATAIGLAIAIDPSVNYSLRERLNRGFGVFREWQSGEQLAFDALLDRSVDPTSNQVVSRKYVAVHNIGHFRFVEYSALDENGQPKGDLSPFGEVVFPFTDQLQQGGYSAEQLAGMEVERIDTGHVIEETYSIDENGIVVASIKDLDTGYQVSHILRAEITA